MAKIRSRAPFREHGVTAAEELKCLPLMYSYTGDAQALSLAKRAYQKVVDNSLMPDGGIVSAEQLEKTAFYSVHESCDISDWSWSFGYMFMATGEPGFADLIERTTFNALPGAVTKDFKQLQYFSAANQTVIGPTNSHSPLRSTRMTYRAAHDTECCPGNINRAMPNYVIRSWMRASDGGLAAVFYCPSVVTAPVGSRSVTIVEETDYPFRDTISFRFMTAQPVAFNFQIRIPQWCDAASVQVNGETLADKHKPGTFASIRREYRDGDVVTVKLPMPVRVESWLNGQSVCVARGPLVYSLKIDEQPIVHTSDPPEIRKLLGGHDIQGFPEIEYYPLSDWRYGFPASLKNELSNIREIESDMTDNPFIETNTPVQLELPLCPLSDWVPAVNGVRPGEPSGLPTADQRHATGPETIMTLVPYGSTHLRLTTLPIVDAGE